MLQGATMQQLQQVQVQSQGTPITVNTHAHKHLYVHLPTHTETSSGFLSAEVTADHWLCPAQVTEVCMCGDNMRSSGLTWIE